MGRHRDRGTHKGESYVRQYQLEHWVNQCQQCQHRGYKPEMVDDPDGPGDRFRKMVFKRFFRPLTLNALGLCSICELNHEGDGCRDSGG
jgi:hypothetical protein